MDKLDRVEKAGWRTLADSGKGFLVREAKCPTTIPSTYLVRIGFVKSSPTNKPGTSVDRVDARVDCVVYVEDANIGQISVRIEFPLVERGRARGGGGDQG